MEFPLSLVKEASGALDRDWIARFARTFELRGFIETGTYLGQSLENVCGLFERSISIELSEELHAAARRKFADEAHVTLLLGDSARRMADAAELCAGLPTLYWLDAHWSAGNTARGDENTPILAELTLIAERASADDVVLIDDMRNFVTVPPGFAPHDALHGYPQIGAVLALLARFPAGGFEAVLSGDVLVCMSRERMKMLKATPAVQAITVLRTDPGLSAAQRRACEEQIGRSRGAERAVFLALPQHYAYSLQFGIGGDFCYWSGLVKEAERDYDGALAEFELARRCKVPVPPRPWEGPGLRARLRRIAAGLLQVRREPADGPRNGACATAPASGTQAADAHEPAAKKSRESSGARV
jgi:hypothetical protein